MRKKLLIITAVVAVLLVLAGLLLWYSMGAPLYTPGLVRAEKNLRSPLEPPKQMEEPGYWRVEDDVRLFYTTQGTGRPILVVHGGPGFPMHRPLMGLEPLTKEHSVICYDQRGCGKSTRPFDRFSSKNYYANMKELEQTLGIGAHVADIERIRRILGKEKLVLLGHSFGAFLAAMYAAEFPEHVEALILVAPAGVLLLPDEGDGFFAEIRKFLPGDKQIEYDAFLKEYLDFGSIFSKSESELAQMNRKLGQFFLTASGLPVGAENNGIPQGNGGWMVHALYFSMGMRHDYRSALKNVEARALIIHGEGDIVPERISRMYADCLPHSRLHLMRTGQTHGGHFPFREQPETFATTVNGFLAGID